jgi:hypothetical protein
LDAPSLIAGIRYARGNKGQEGCYQGVMCQERCTGAFIVAYSSINENERSSTDA